MNALATLISNNNFNGPIHPFLDNFDYRFQKCLLIGMEKSWVMTEEERLQMLKSRLEKKKMEKMSLVNKCKLKEIKRFGRIKNEYEPDINIVHNYLSEEDVSVLFLCLKVICFLCMS